MEIVTADTNIYVSALNYGGKPLHLLEQARAGVIRLAISDDIQGEVRRVLHEKFNWPEEDLAELDGDLPSFTVNVIPTQRLQVVKDDPDDDWVLECAVASGSTAVVSGDRHLLAIGQYEGIPIMRVADFLRQQQEAERGR